MKKKTKKKVVKKSARAKLMAKKKVIKKKAPIKQIELEFYRVDIEMKHYNGTILEYYFQTFSKDGGEDLSVAETVVRDMKELGQGGRLVLLDGTPEGKIVETWPSVTRAMELAKIEQKELDKKSPQVLV